MAFRKLVISGVISIGVFTGSLGFSYAQTVSYKVEQGDTFWIISNKYGISMDNLMKANNANQNTVLYQGQSLVIPVGNQTVHTVKSGDTYWLISKAYGVDFNKLLAANNANQNSYVQIGDKVIIPTGTQTTPTPSGYILHTITSVDSFWTLGKKYNIDYKELMAFNGADENTQLIDGKTVKIPVRNSSGGVTAPTPAPAPVQPSSPEPAQNYFLHTITSTDSFWTLGRKYNIDYKELMAFNDANENTQLIDGRTVKIPVKSTTGSVTPTVPAPAPVPEPAPAPAPQPAPQATKPYITYDSYIVNHGDNFWALGEKFGIPALELMKVNNMTESSYLKPGTTIKVPVHHIPVKETPGAKYGELLDWWTEAQYVIPRGASFEVVDFYTGRSFNAKRTAGSFHADCEPLTKEDTAKMKEIWGGSLTWTRRPVIIRIDGRQIAASSTSIGHAGNDYSPGGVWTEWRSANYGAGTNHDYIKNNDMDGHFDIHFLNSTRHKDAQLDPKHQANIKISGGAQ